MQSHGNMAQNSHLVKEDTRICCMISFILISKNRQINQIEIRRWLKSNAGKMKKEQGTF